MAKLNRVPVQRPLSTQVGRTVSAARTSRINTAIATARSRGKGGDMPYIRSLQGLMRYQALPEITSGINKRLVNMHDGLTNNKAVMDQMTRLHRLRAQLTINPNPGKIAWDTVGDFNWIKDPGAVIRKIQEDIRTQRVPHWISNIFFENRNGTGKPRTIEPTAENLRNLIWVVCGHTGDPKKPREIEISVEIPAGSGTFKKIKWNGPGAGEGGWEEQIRMNAEYSTKLLGDFLYVDIFPDAKPTVELAKQLLDIQKKLIELLNSKIDPDRKNRDKAGTLANGMQHIINNIERHARVMDYDLGFINMRDGDPTGDKIKENFFTLWVLDQNFKGPLLLLRHAGVNDLRPYPFEPSSGERNHIKNQIDDANRSAEMYNENGKMILKEDLHIMETWFQTATTILKGTNEAIMTLAKGMKG